MAACEQAGRIVFRAIDHSLLQRRIQLAKWYGRRTATERRDHVVRRLAGQHTQFHFPDIFRPEDRLADRVETAAPGVVIADANHSLVLTGLKYLRTDVA